MKRCVGYYITGKQLSVVMASGGSSTGEGCFHFCSCVLVITQHVSIPRIKIRAKVAWREHLWIQHTFWYIIHSHRTSRLGREEVYLLLILDLGTRWGEWSASRLGHALPPGKGAPVSIVQEAGWVPEPVWTQEAKRKTSIDRSQTLTDWATRLIKLLACLNNIRKSETLVSTLRPDNPTEVFHVDTDSLRQTFP
jgi:hypothetical protein